MATIAENLVKITPLHLEIIGLQGTINNKVNKHIHNCFTALRILSGTTWVSRYQKKHTKGPLTN